MAPSIRALALAAATLLVASCGGGGGGTTATPPPTSTTPPPPPSGTPMLAITAANAKPASASGLDTAENTSATRGAAGLPTGVEVSGDGGTPMLLAIAEAVRLADDSFAAGHLPAGVALNQTVACPLGGSLTISGSIAASTSISVGDTLTVTAANCSLSTGTATFSMNGSMTMKFATATSALAPPFHIVVNVTVSNLSVTTGGTTVVGNGDVRLDWNATSSTTQTLSSTGTTMSSRETINGVSHTVTLHNYNQTLTINGSTYSGTIAATVDTDSSKLGTGTVSYTITTPTPVVWNAATRVATAGVIKMVGANNSQLVITINADGTVTIQIDANGDGVFETTIQSTVAELAGLI